MRAGLRFIYVLIFIKGRTKYYNLMEKQLLLALLVLGFSSYGFAKPNEKPSVNGKYLLVNTEQGSANDSVSLVEEDGNWKALKNRNGKIIRGIYLWKSSGSSIFLI